MGEQNQSHYDIYDGGNPAVHARLQDVMLKAEQWFPPNDDGNEQLFTYPDRQRKQFVTMTLREAMYVCGPMIATEDDESIRERLDEMRRNANKLSSNERMLEQTKKVGQDVLARVMSERADG